MELLLTSVLAFFATNIDDIFLLTLFFGSRRFRTSQVVIGQMIGISALIGISVIGSLLGLFFDPAYIGLLGLFPIYLGVKELLEFFRNNNASNLDVQELKSGGTISVSAITIANGGDNIGIYVPLFATLSWMEKSIMIVVFLGLTLFWCWLAWYITKHPWVENAIGKYGKPITGFVLILLGLYILAESNSFALFF